MLEAREDEEEEDEEEVEDMMGEEVDVVTASGRDTGRDTGRGRGRGVDVLVVTVWAILAAFPAR